MPGYESNFRANQIENEQTQLVCHTSWK